MSLEDKLAKIGVVGKSYHFYMAAVGLGEAPVQEVAARAGLRRTTAYDVLEKLEADGLLRVTERDGRRYVHAEDPVVLLQRVELHRQVLADVMPQLRSLYNLAKGKPQIHFHEGIEGVRTVLRDTLTAQNKVLRGILSMGELMETPGLDDMESSIAERVSRGIQLKVVRSRGKDVDNIWPSSPDALRELRYAPDHVVLSMTQYIYDNKVAMISSRREDYGLIIESEEFAELQGALFDLLWAASTPA